MPPPASDRPTSSSRSSGGLVQHSLAVTGALGFVVAQPLYDLLKGHGAFFVAHQADRLDLLGVCAVLSFALPAAGIVLLGVARRIHERLERGLFFALIGGCGTLQALLLARRFELPVSLSIAVALLAAALAFRLAGRPTFRKALSILALGAVLFPTLFLLAPGIRSLWSPEPETGAPGGSVRATGDEAVAAIGEHEAPDPPVVLIVFDELPTVSLMTADHSIDAGLFPNFARLVGTATWFPYATTVAQSTIFAVPAILAGRHPQPREALTPNLRGYPDNLFTLLDADVFLNGWETSTRLCPQLRCQPPAQWLIPRRQRLPAILEDAAAIYLLAIAPPGWGGDLSAVEDQWSGFWGRRTLAASKRPPKGAAQRVGSPDSTFAWFLNRLEGHGRKPGVHFVHTMLPHAPWIWLPSGQRFERFEIHPHGMVNQSWRGSEWETTQAHQRHLLAVGCADRMLGELIEVLERLDLFDPALIIVTSDHGSTFETGALRRNVRQEPFDALVSVPLIVKFPGQRKAVLDDRNAETVDVLPTILEALGKPSSPWITGLSLAGPPRPVDSIKRTFRSGNRGPTGRTSAGSPLEYTVDQIVGRQAAIERKLDRFGTGDWERVFAAGPHPELMGRRPSALDLSTPSTALVAEIVGLDRFADVDPSADFLPVHLYGSLGASPDPPVVALAVALEGRIVATTEPFAHQDGRLDFTALFSPSALRQGTNRLELFSIVAENPPTGSQPSVRLLPIPVAPATFEL